MSQPFVPMPQPADIANLSMNRQRQALVESLPLWFWSMDREWRITGISDSVRRVTGIEPSDVIGIQVMDPAHGREESEGGLGPYFGTLRARKTFTNFCYERILVSGARSVLMDSAFPVFDATGAFDGYHGVSFQLSRAIEQAGETASLVYSLSSRADALERELSDRNDELEETNRLLTEIMDAMGEGLLVTSGSEPDDPDNMIQFANPAYLEQFGLTADQVAPGMAFPRLVDLLSGRGDRIEEQVPATDSPDLTAGSQAWLVRVPSQNRSLFCKSASRPSGGQVMVHTDVTEMEKRSAALETALKQAGAASAAKSNFLAAMSHEFRTPMNGIVGMTDLLADTALDDEQQELVATIQSSANALTGLISDILDFSKIEAGQERLVIEPLSLAALGRDVIALLRPLAQRKGLDLRLELAPDLPLTVLGDVLRLRQILLNLLGNAVKFTLKGHVVLSMAGTNPVTIRIEDTGIGIPAGDLETIHEPFRQVQNGLHRQFEGTGLGLAISRRLVGMMGGETTVTSQVGAGTCFTLTLPLEPSGEHVAPKSAGLANMRDLSGFVVLVAEDNRTNQLVMRKMLERVGATVRIVTSGTAAVESARDPRIDLILMDVSMPGMNGFDACRAIRAQESENGRSRCPVIAVTGNAFDKDRDTAQEAGMDDFLAKPVRRVDLMESVARHLGNTPNGADDESVSR